MEAGGQLALPGPQAPHRALRGGVQPRGGRGGADVQPAGGVPAVPGTRGDCVCAHERRAEDQARGRAVPSGVHFRPGAPGVPHRAGPHHRHARHGAGVQAHPRAHRHAGRTGLSGPGMGEGSGRSGGVRVPHPLCAVSDVLPPRGVGGRHLAHHEPLLQRVHPHLRAYVGGPAGAAGVRRGHRGRAHLDPRSGHAAVQPFEALP
mmetsp:Transcript_40622/g.76019  ORF Transcript_40622/g.76019 Transcript_40622/m.76019 type:complete len:204 (-) Transcript_40622:856-1467(-)